jgi:pimeloyl-ACP methyl ester carboxylesterase
MSILLTLAGFVSGLVAMALAASWLFSFAVARKVGDVLPPTGRLVDVAGTRLHVHASGEGPAVLMIHGLGGQLCHFTYGVAGRLAGRYRVVAVDRPGSGWSPALPGGEAGLSAQAAVLAALIERLGLGRPLVVGHSLGGAVALALALEHPDKVSGLALLAPLTHMPDDVPPVFKGLAIGSPALRRLVAWTLAIPASIRKGGATLEQVFGPETAPKDLGTRGGGLLSLRPSAFLGASADLRALPARLPALEQGYGRLRIPVGVLYGRADRILDWRANGQALADKVTGARLELVDGGHMLPVTQPDACAAFIDRMAQASGLRYPVDADGADAEDGAGAGASGARRTGPLR